MKFWRAFLDGLADLASLGERPFHVGGYPHASEADALRSDWAALGHDLAKHSTRARSVGEAPDSAEAVNSKSREGT